MFKTTVDSVLSSMSKKISQLRVLSGEHHNQYLVHVEESIRHADLSQEHLVTRDRAARIADKFEELLK